MNFEEIKKLRGLVAGIHKRVENERDAAGQRTGRHALAVRTLTDSAINQIEKYIDEREKEMKNELAELMRKTDELIESIKADREKIDITPEDLIYKG